MLEALAGCAVEDAIPGEACLTVEKASKLFVRSLGDIFRQFNLECLDAIVHRSIVRFTDLNEAAGCN